MCVLLNKYKHNTYLISIAFSMLGLCLPWFTVTTSVMGFSWGVGLVPMAAALYAVAFWAYRHTVEEPRLPFAALSVSATLGMTVSILHELFSWRASFAPGDLLYESTLPSYWLALALSALPTVFFISEYIKNKNTLAGN